MTNIEEFQKIRRQAEGYARAEQLNMSIYLSGSKNKRTYFEKQLKRYQADIILDCELEVIGREEARTLALASKIIEKSIEQYEVY